ncbi:hypothetical protein WEH80_32445 [Actinomycetes bacterium KLBMP 9759]
MPTGWSASRVQPGAAALGGPRAPLGAAVFRPAAPGRTERELEPWPGWRSWWWGRSRGGGCARRGGLDAEGASRATEWALGVLTAAIAEEEGGS